MAMAFGHAVSNEGPECSHVWDREINPNQVMMPEFFDSLGYQASTEDFSVISATSPVGCQS